MRIKLKTLIEILFPPTADELCFRTHKDSLLPPPPLGRNNDLIYLYPYHQPEVRAMMHLAKFHCYREAQQVLAQALATAARPYIKEHILVPIPLSKKRERKRGYNQVTEILQQLNKLEPIIIDQKLLRRTRHTLPQTSLDRSARLNNLKDAFVVTRPERVRGKDIVLLDDVATTGATMAAARAALKLHSPASITCLALAH